MDRDLQRTGNSIVLLSAGAGIFTVDFQLAQITKQRMMDNGIGMDMLSLAVPPLHIAPIFMQRPRNGKGNIEKKINYEIPHWINLSFVDPVRAEEPRAWIAAAAPRRARDGWRMARLDLDAPRRRFFDDEYAGSTQDQLPSQHVLDGWPEARFRRTTVAIAKRSVPRALAYLVDSSLASLPDENAIPYPLQSRIESDKQNSMCPIKQSIELGTDRAPYAYKAAADGALAYISSRVNQLIRDGTKCSGLRTSPIA